MASLLSFFRSGPPPPKVVLLPDGSFFTRQVPIAPGTAPADVAAQVELALEAISPFPLTQLYYGWYTQPGADRAFVFAAYRRRFTTDQVGGWDGAELVMPGFASVFGAPVEPATTLFIAGPETLTAVHWDGPGIPAKVLVRPIVPDADEAERNRVREELLTALGGSKTVIDLPAPPEPDPSAGDREVTFKSGEIVSTLPSNVTAAFDVRDKGELVALRAAQRRDLMLWRTMLGCAAALVLLAVGELALVGGRAWQSVRIAERNGYRPKVEKIMAAQSLAQRIEDLATKQLLPLEMLTELDKPKPPEVLFTRAVADKNVTGIYTVVIDAQTTNPAQMAVYEAAVKNLPSVDHAELVAQGSRGNLATFKLTVTFKPGALKPVTS